MYFNDMFWSNISLKPRRTRSKKLLSIYILIIFAVSFVITAFLRLTYGDFLSDLPAVATDIFKLPDDVTCYRKDYGTPDILDNIPKHAIYLISASCESGLSLHQACTIEAVTRAHIDRKIFVLLTRPVEDCKCSEGLQAGLESIPTVHFVRIQIDQFVQKTPVEGIFDDNFFDIGLRKHKRVSEILKFVALYKYGGVVIDMDMIMAKPVTFLGLNWAVKINGSMLGSAIVSINKDSLLGKQLLPLILRNLKAQRQNKEINGGKAMTEAFKKLCYDSPAEGCSEFRIYDTRYFYPLNESSSQLYFHEGYLSAMAYGYHIWDSRHIVRRSGSVYARLMREYCPNVLSFL